MHDHTAIEIQRGCTQGCRFCQAGIIYRPRLEREPEEVLAAARSCAHTGYDELSLVSLSTTDQSRIVRSSRAARGARRHTDDLAALDARHTLGAHREVVATRGKHSITFAPEAGTERLRMTINKNVTDDDLYDGRRERFDQGWTNVKMYFMVGQPTETHEDIEGIVTLAQRVREIGRRHHGGRARVRISTSNFIPKAHTPFQWHRRRGRTCCEQRHQYLRDALKKAGVTVHVGGPRAQPARSGAITRRPSLGGAIQRAWQAGARFDAWHEHYNWPRWERRSRTRGLDPETYGVPRARAAVTCSLGRTSTPA